VVAPTVLGMEKTSTTGPLRVVGPDEVWKSGQPVAGATCSGTSPTEDYWAKVRELRATLEELRPAN